MNIDKQSAAEFHIGNNTVGTTAQKMTTLSFPVYNRVRVKAAAGNAGVIYVGLANVSSAECYPLAAGEEVPIEIDATDKIWVRASEAAQGYKWVSV